ncbi:DUF1876 domain-containing protein [Nocardioides panacis]|jgi:hypothetical protein|uniref:DUF1876 domain-containing protein n=1 Tax=Nocardioides panacis TaxID=2849501 RepID=A0A975SZL2_9ACTN|nr:dsRBD fold-containing protein [Nocardioides panacis]QWZ08776.1 DUF1876 domain-containing protein [Nocardioides panacis]
MSTRTAPTGTRTWSVEIRIDEHDGETHAQARLHTGDATSLSASGSARLSPRDRDVPEIGDELAAARALSRLAHELLDAAAGDIENLTHEHVDLDH